MSSEFGTSFIFRGWVRVRVFAYGSGVRGRKVVSRDCALASDLVRALITGLTFIGWSPLCFDKFISNFLVIVEPDVNLVEEPCPRFFLFQIKADDELNFPDEREASESNTSHLVVGGALGTRKMHLTTKHGHKSMCHSVFLLHHIIFGVTTDLVWFSCS